MSKIKHESSAVLWNLLWSEVVYVIDKSDSVSRQNIALHRENVKQSR